MPQSREIGRQAKIRKRSPLDSTPGFGHTVPVATPLRTRLLTILPAAFVALSAVAWSWHWTVDLPEPYRWRAQAQDPELRLFRQDWAEFEGEPATVLYRLIMTSSIDRPGSDFEAQRLWAVVAGILAAAILSTVLLARRDPARTTSIDRALLLGTVFLLVLHPAYGATWLLGSRFGGPAVLLIFAAALAVLSGTRWGRLRRVLSALLAVSAVALDRSGVLVPWALIPAAAASAKRERRSPVGVVALWLLLANLATLLVRSTAGITPMSTLISRGFEPWLLMGEALILPSVPWELRAVALGLALLAAAWPARLSDPLRGNDGVGASLVLQGSLALLHAGGRHVESANHPAAEAELWAVASALMVGLLALAWSKLPAAALRLLLGVVTPAPAWSAWQGPTWPPARGRVLDQASAGLALERTPEAPPVATVPVFGRIELLGDLLGQGRLPEFSTRLPERFPESAPAAPPAEGILSFNMSSGRLDGTLILPWWRRAPGAIVVLAWDESGQSHLVGAGLIGRTLFEDESDFSIPLVSGAPLPSSVTLQCLALSPGGSTLPAWPMRATVGPDLKVLPGAESPR